jgi:hypothetical protein
MSRTCQVALQAEDTALHNQPGGPTHYEVVQSVTARDGCRWVRWLAR